MDRALRDEKGESRLTCIFVNNGVLRKDEFEKVQQNLRDKLGLHVDGVDASSRFLRKLSGITDPEAKRKIIGNEFIPGRRAQFLRGRAGVRDLCSAVSTGASIERIEGRRQADAASALTNHGTPNRSINIPNRGAQNVSSSGITTRPPCASSRNTRSASSMLAA